MSPQRIIWNTDLNRKKPSHIGGSPWLLSDLEYPRCKYCHNLMAFYFVIDISEVMENKGLQLFACISCITQDTAVPKYPDFGTRIVDDKYAKELQTNYRINIFDFHSEIMFLDAEYLPIIESGVSLLNEKNPKSRWSRIGGEPPEKYQITSNDNDAVEYKFIMQIAEKNALHFKTKIGSPYQSKIDWFGDGEVFIKDNYYTLFGEVKIMIYFAYNSETEAFAVAGRG